MQPTPLMETSETSAVVAAVSALAAAACLIAVAIVMTRKRSGSSEPAKGLADTAGPAQHE
jgi:ABC-type spermidine/putrescine transport system permease subunit II